MQKFILIFMLLMLLVTKSFSQTYYQVTTYNGTQSIGGINVTNSLTGGVVWPYNYTYCTFGPFWIQQATSFSRGYKFVFSNSVYAIKARFLSVEPGDTIGVRINGLPFYITNANLTGYGIASCSLSNNLLVLAINGFIAGQINSSLNGAQLDIYGGFNIDSVEIFEISAGTGFGFSFFFASGCGATPIMHTDTPCIGDSLHLGVQVPGTTISYNWSGPNGFSSTAQYPAKGNVALADSGMYYVSISADSCTYYDSVWVSILPNAIPTISANTNHCAGDTLYLSATSPYTAAWQWLGPNSFSDTLSTTQRNTLQFIDSGYYSVSTLLANGCTSSDSVFIHVKPAPNFPNISSNSPICVGDTLKLNLNNPQTSVNYSWSGPASFSSILQNPQRINAQTTYSGSYQILANLNGCTKASSLNATVNPLLGPPTINIHANPDSICVGQNITLTATVSNAGNPQYTWKQNGLPTGPNAASFTTGTVANGDVFICKLSSNLQCQAIDTAHSNNLSIQVIYHAPPNVYITQYPTNFTPGTPVTFTGHPSYTNGLTYVWQVNGITQSSTANFFSSNTLNQGDSICLITYSHINCTIPDSVRTCTQIGEGITTLTPTNILFYPNPIDNELIIGNAPSGTSIKVYDVVGRLIFSGNHLSNKQTINTGTWERGTYLVEIQLPDGKREVRNMVK
jgi:hypothetical protein